jgi:mitogen-activated protein kinase 15
MNDNKKYSIQEYREALYAEFFKRRRCKGPKWTEKYLRKLGISSDAMPDAKENENGVSEKATRPGQ